MIQLKSSCLDGDLWLLMNTQNKSKFFVSQYRWLAPVFQLTQTGRFEPLLSASRLLEVQQYGFLHQVL